VFEVEVGTPNLLQAATPRNSLGAVEGTKDG